MNTEINRNYLWCELFVEELVSCGLSYAVLLPGSRNTPLTSAFARNQNVKCFSMIDERSGAFFALGLAKLTGLPAAIVSTSGTAAAEFYPAIIEASRQKTPMIVCTADRPLELLDCGANQTINQTNLYGGFVNKFFDAGIPEVSLPRLKHIRALAHRCFSDSYVNNKGPVHINFPFRKPLESSTYTDIIDKSILTELRDHSIHSTLVAENSPSQSPLPDCFFEDLLGKRILFIAGPGSYSPALKNTLSVLSEKLDSPVLADALSNMRFGKYDKTHVLACYEGYFRSQDFVEEIEPDFVFLFGNAPTSKALEDFLENHGHEKYSVNSEGIWTDPFNSFSGIIKTEPLNFCVSFLNYLDKKNKLPETKYFSCFESAQKWSDEQKFKYIENAEFPFEGRIITELFQIIPDNSLIMVSNSMPARDLDYFTPLTDKNITIFNNRGASGIDGITSTAMGISAAAADISTNDTPVILITGDLAFYYDLNGLLASSLYKLNLIVILINNNGGGIFEMLPVSKEKDIFDKYFTTPHNLDFSNFVSAYNGKLTDILSWEHFRQFFRSAINYKGLNVLHINTNSFSSTLTRKKFWESAASKILY